LVGAPADRFVISRHNVGPFHNGPWHRQLGQWVERRADLVIAISEAVREQTTDHLRIGPEKIRTIHYGIDPEPFRSVPPSARERPRAEWGIRDDALVIGTIGRLVPQKALHVLLAGYARYSRVASRPSSLVVVGSGPLENELKALAVELRLGDSAIWTGFRDDTPAIMSALDVFALASDFEGFGLVLLEAMAAGKPVVATMVSAIPEVVKADVTGLLCPPGDPIAFGNALARIEDETLRKTMGAAGRARVAEFALDRMVEDTMKVYRDVLNADRMGRSPYRYGNETIGGE
jgi:glycosyltransferase involved in cell wall biosynthesis